MPVVGKITAKFEADTKALDASLAGIEGAVNGTTAVVTAGFSKMEGQLAQTQKSVGQIALGGQLQAGAAVFGQLAGAVDGFRQELNRAGGDADDLRDRLAATFGDIADEKAALAEQSLTLGFDPEQTANALVTLKKFGADSEQTLAKIQDAARFTNQSVDGLAEAFGKFEKFGDSKSLLALQKQLGVSNQDLKAFGAALDANGKPLLDTEARLQAAKTALEEYTKVNFTGAAARQADAATQLQGNLELLKREVGLNVTQFKEGFAPALNVGVNALRGMSDGTKAALGLGVEFVGMAASMGATALTAGAQLVILAGNATVMARATQAATLASNGLRTALTFLTGPVGILVTLTASLALGFAAYTAELEKANAAAEDLIAIEEKRAKGLKENQDIVGKSAEELQKMGKSTRDVGNVILGLNDQVQAARNTGNTDLAAKIAGQIAQLRVERSRLAEIQAGIAADKKGSVEDPSAKEQAKLDKQAAKDKKIADKEAETARKAEVTSQLGAVKEAAAARKLDLEGQISAFQQILNQANLNNKEKAALSLQIAQLQGRLRAEETAEQKKAEATRTAEAKKADRERTAEAKKEASERAREVKKAEAAAKSEAKKDDSQEKADTGKIQALAKEKASAEKKAIDEQVQALEGDLSKKGGAFQAIQALLEKKLAITIAEIEAERDATIAATKNEKIKAAAADSAEAQIRAARAETTNQLKTEADKQKAALQTVADKQKAVIAEMNQNAITSQVGGKNSPLFSDPTQGLGISFSGSAPAKKLVSTTPTVSPVSTAIDSVAGKIRTIDSEIGRIDSLAALTKKGAEKLDQLRTQRAVLTDSATNELISRAKLTPKAASPTIAPAVDPSKAQATAIADALKSAPIAITVVANVEGAAPAQQTFSGTADQLSRASNIFSAGHTLGKP